MTTLYIPEVPEFAPVWQWCNGQHGMRIQRHAIGYVQIEAEGAIELRRAELRIPLSVWFGVPTGGLLGRVALFDKDVLRLEPAEQESAQ